MIFYFVNREFDMIRKEPLFYDCSIGQIILPFKKAYEL